jgi:hypothetical protein
MRWAPSVLLLLGAPAQLCRAYDLSCPTCATSHVTAVATSVSVPASSNNVAIRDWVTYDLSVKLASTPQAAMGASGVVSLTPWSIYALFGRAQNAMTLAPSFQISGMLGALLSLSLSLALSLCVCTTEPLTHLRDHQTFFRFQRWRHPSRLC